MEAVSQRAHKGCNQNERDVLAGYGFLFSIPVQNSDARTRQWSKV